MKKLLFVFLLLFTFAAKSQDSTYVQLELKNGKLIKGQLIQKSDAEVIVATKDLGKVTLAWSTIKSMNMISKDGNVMQDHNRSMQHIRVMFLLEYVDQNF